MTKNMSSEEIPVQKLLSIENTNHDNLIPHISPEMPLEEEVITKANDLFYGKTSAERFLLFLRKFSAVLCQTCN